jgi:hypothetical protein
MADDILGHEHLDHGKHLHKHGHHHHVSPHWRHNTGHEIHKHGHHEHEGHHEHKHQHNTHVPVDYKQWGIAAIVALTLAVALYNYSAGFTLFLIILVANTVIEYHKLFTEGAPIDLEVITLGTAVLAATAGFLWGVILAVVGPTIAQLSRGNISSETMYKSAALVITAAAGYLLGSGQWDLFIAVIFGILAQYIAAAVVGQQTNTHNAIARLTTLALSTYLIFVFF